MNKWSIAIIYCSLLTTFCYLSIKTVLLSAMTPTSSPNPKFFVGIFGLTFGGLIFGFGIRKYVSFATEDEKERRKLKTMFSIISILSCYIAIMLFFI
ncbi:hypothetical protein BK735_21370 [Bacillus mycoides]|uniref:hypothetical protein n=1 Tax=Bacillus TaxID=1386 RepID=UPI0003E2B001|nr:MULTISPECIES: hypothetical protein [Bacillus cereus group]ETT85527.1 hypothetical protein C174_01544 [Bacillus mycoides FSL H7-687]MBG9721742.1 hypothetical protein [Bacillus mycoides]MBJ8018389.1 hypothetical protein [Bacillus cereus group sp. N34]MCP9225118.1 hypothetical protein [Bacillus mycoides]OOR66685.1 hypothetical protein BLW98_20745 [Bacillus mycoides]